MNSRPCLSIVSVAIGNPLDVTERAKEVLRTSDLIICEEWKPARALLHKLSIDDKPLIKLTEHSKSADEEEILNELESGKLVALISDCGTPLIADPGSSLVKKCIDRGINITPIPGPSSILAAVVVSGFSLEQFSFIGFLPREKSERKQAAIELRSRRETLIILEAPYRLQQLLDDLTTGIGQNRNAAIALDLTTDKERIIHNTLGGLQEYFSEHPFKGEFVIVIEGSRAPTHHKKLPLKSSRNR